MSQPVVVTFNAANTTLIASDQQAVASVSLALNNTDINGNHIDSVYCQTMQSVTIPNFESPITLTSTDDYSTVDFTIVGYDIYSRLVTEVLTGPNNETVTSTESYNRIVSITGNAAGVYPVGNISAGTGDIGLSKWIKLDANRTNSALASIQAEVTGTITYTVYGTLSRVEDNVNGVQVPHPNAFPEVLTNFNGVNASVVSAEPYKNQAIQVEVSASDANAALTVTILQVGI